MNSSKKKRKNKYWLLKQDGTTLVELIVVFALIGMFMTAAALMMTSSLRLFTRMQSTSRAITVSDMILDKVAGEISAAVFPVGKPKQDDYYFWLGPDSKWVAFKNRLDSPIAIFAAARDDAGNADTGTLGSGELFVRYYKLDGVNTPQQAELDWRYDDQVYMGYEIAKLNFMQVNIGKDPSVIKIELTLVHKLTGFEYSTYRYARVYNTDYTGDYLGVRSKFDPENTGLPMAAGEFVIQSKEEPETPENPEPENPEPENPTEPEKPAAGRPFTTVGKKYTIDYKTSGEWNEVRPEDMVKTEVFASNIRDFCNSDWSMVEIDGNIGYYKSFTHNGDRFALAGLMVQDEEIASSMKKAINEEGNIGNVNSVYNIASYKDLERGKIPIRDYFGKNNLGASNEFIFLLDENYQITEITFKLDNHPISIKYFE